MKKGGIAMTEQQKEQNTSKRDGRRFLMIILSFFVTVACVDAYFVYKALSTHSGVVVDKPYERGIHFNELLNEAKEKGYDSE